VLSTQRRSEANFGKSSTSRPVFENRFIFSDMAYLTWARDGALPVALRILNAR
jgi:hypothetical protein